MGVYDTDLTGYQWRMLQPYLPDDCERGRPRKTCLRRVIDAIFYLLKTGCQWRSLPADFPPWRTVYGYFAQWRDDGFLDELHQIFYRRLRHRLGRNVQPSALVIDSQSVKTSKMGGMRGYDGGKRVKGRKRHVVTDTLGLPVAFSVTKANMHDSKGGQLALKRAKAFAGKAVRAVFADGSYGGQPFRQFVRTTFNKARVVVAGNLAQVYKTFVPVPKRWVIERAFAWFYDYRRLTIDYERKLKTSKAMLRLAALRIILNRLDPNVNFGRRW